MTVKEMREQRAKLIADARALLDLADNEKRELSDEENVQYDAIMDDAAKVKGQVVREEALEAEERDLAAVQNPGHRPDPNPEDDGADEERAAAEKRAAFSRFLRVGQNALNGDEMRALQADSDIAGGYLVAPQEWSTKFIQAKDNLVFMRGLADVQMVTNADSLGVPTLETDMGDVTWTAELLIGSEDSSMEFGKRELSPHPLARYIKVSNKLIRASTKPVEDLVRERLAYKFGTVEENAFINGSGAGQPLGVMTASDDGIGTGQDVSTDNTTTAFTADGLINCMFKLKPAYRRTSSWLFHTDAVKMLSKLKQGTGNYLWSPGLKGGTPDTMLNRPIYESAYMPSTFTTGLYVGIFGDFKYYWIVDALNVQIQVLKELFAATNQTGFVGRVETDGMPVLAEAFARVKLG